MTLRRLGAVLVIGAAIVLWSCGGSSSESGGSATSPSNKWDSLVWDQGSWG